MSIRPIDHNVMIPKTQEVSSLKQVENMKNKNIVESEFIQQEKLIKHNSKKVLTTEESVYNKVKDEERSNHHKDSGQRKKRKKNQSLTQKGVKDPNKGHGVDIRI